MLKMNVFMKEDSKQVSFQYDKLKPYQRIKILDELFRSGDYVSFQDCVNALDPGEVKLKNLNAHIKSRETVYGRNFRQDTATIKSIIRNAKGVDADMLITEGTNKYKRYKYKDPNFTILDYWGYRYTKGNYKKLDEALTILRNSLPNDVFEQVEFILRSRIDYDYGNRDKSIDYGENLWLRGRNMLPLLYKCINQTTITVSYKTYNDESETYILHPYLLKQHNNRWFLFGLRPDKKDNYWCVPLDRIEYVKQADVAIIPRPDGYINYFDDIIGTTKGMLMENGKINNAAEKILITLEVSDKETWKRMTTKPIHHSQKSSDFKEGIARIDLDLIPNREFYNSLITAGKGIKIIKPEIVSKVMDSICGDIIGNNNETYSIVTA